MSCPYQFWYQSPMLDEWNRLILKFGGLGKLEAGYGLAALWPHAGVYYTKQNKK